MLKKQTIATMESCTGGALSSYITNIKGASNVFKFGAITYDEEAKIKMGVNLQTIKKYLVVSQEVAQEMSYQIAKKANASYGVGITGNLTTIDSNTNLVYISIYDKENNKYFNTKLEFINKSRLQSKNIVINKVIEMLNNII